MSQRFLIVAVFLICGFPRVANAQVLPLPQTNSESDFEEVVEAPENPNEPEDAFEEDELSYSSLELREGSEYALALSLGASMPWQSLGIDVKYIYSPSITIDWQTGYMEGRFSNRKDDVAYEINYVALSTYVGAQWFFTESLPFYVEPLIGLVRWDGKIKTMGAIDQTPAATATLSGAFVQARPFFGASIGLLQVWASGWFLEYALLGSGAAGSALEHSFTPGDMPHKNLVEEALGKVTTWGIVNLKVGYFF